MTGDRELLWVFGSILGLLLVATLVGLWLRRRADSLASRTFAEHILVRTRAWWMMCLVFAVAVVAGQITTIILFALLSFLALREFVTVASTSRADHRALFWLFFVVVPVQYALAYVGWYGMFAIFIPVYVFLFVAVRITLAGDCTRFLERVATVQWGLMVCVYCVSHVPAILKLNLPGFEGKSARLLMFLVVTVELCDVLQFIWGKLIGGPKIVPSVSPNKTWSGFLGGVLSASAVGLGLWWITPFTPLQALAIALAISVMGFLGDVTLSAVKRSAHLKDYGQLLPGHGGILDRIDSLCFAAPVFFHVTRYCFSGNPPAGF